MYVTFFTFGSIDALILFLVIFRAVDPDPHSFSLLDPHSKCGTGSRREDF